MNMNEVYEVNNDFYMIQVIQIIRTEFCPGLSKWVLTTSSLEKKTKNIKNPNFSLF